MDTRLIEPLPLEELDRRWQAVAAVMRAHELDALVMQNHNDWLGGYVRWFSGGPANNAYPRAVAFFGPGDMVVAEQGPVGGARVPAKGETAWRGVREVRFTPSYTTAASTADDDADLIADALEERGARAIGWVNPAGAYHGFGRRLIERRHGRRLVDVTDAVDEIKAIKSAVEQALIRRTAALQDQVIADVAGFIRPGMRDFEISAFAQYRSQQLGAEQGIYISSSSPRGTAAMFRPRHMQGRTIERGDTFALLVETNGPGGYYTEIGRTYSLGAPDPELVAAVQAMVDAQKHTLDMLKPGVAVAEVFRRHNEYMAARGLPLEKRLYCHGQGYDMVERPLIRDDDAMILREDMSIVVHPGIITGAVNGLVCDNYWIGAEGASASLHVTSQEIIEI